MSLIKDKNAGIEKYFSLTDFLMYLVVILGFLIFISFFAAFSADLREKEAHLLKDKIYDCLVEQGYLNENFLENSFDIYKSCSLNKKAFDNDKFYFRVYFKDSLNKSKVIESSISHLTECRIQQKDSGEKAGSSKAEKWLKCFESKDIVFYYDKGEIKKGNLEILTGSNNKLENMS